MTLNKIIASRQPISSGLTTIGSPTRTKPPFPQDRCVTPPREVRTGVSTEQSPSRRFLKEVSPGERLKRLPQIIQRQLSATLEAVKDEPRPTRWHALMAAFNQIEDHLSPDNRLEFRSLMSTPVRMGVRHVLSPNDSEIKAQLYNTILETIQIFNRDHLETLFQALFLDRSAPIQDFFRPERVNEVCVKHPIDAQLSQLEHLVLQAIFILQEKVKRLEDLNNKLDGISDTLHSLVNKIGNLEESSSLKSSLPKLEALSRSEFYIELKQSSVACNLTLSKEDIRFLKKVLNEKMVAISRNETRFNISLSGRLSSTPEEFAFQSQAIDKLYLLLIDELKSCNSKQSAPFDLNQVDLCPYTIPEFTRHVMRATFKQVDSLLQGDLAPDSTSEKMATSWSEKKAAMRNNCVSAIKQSVYKLELSEYSFLEEPDQTKLQSFKQEALDCGFNLFASRITQPLLPVLEPEMPSLDLFISLAKDFQDTLSAGNAYVEQKQLYFTRILSFTQRLPSTQEPLTKRQFIEFCKTEKLNVPQFDGKSKEQCCEWLENGLMQCESLRTLLTSPMLTEKVRGFIILSQAVYSELANREQLFQFSNLNSFELPIKQFTDNIYGELGLSFNDYFDRLSLIPVTETAILQQIETLKSNWIALSEELQFGPQQVSHTLIEELSCAEEKLSASGQKMTATTVYYSGRPTTEAIQRYAAGGVQTVICEAAELDAFVASLNPLLGHDLESVKDKSLKKQLTGINSLFTLSTSSALDDLSKEFHTMKPCDRYCQTFLPYFELMLTNPTIPSTPIPRRPFEGIPPLLLGSPNSKYKTSFGQQSPDGVNLLFSPTVGGHFSEFSPPRIERHLWKGTSHAGCEC